MATDLTPPFPDRREQGRGHPGYRVRKVRRSLRPVWEVTGEWDGVAIQIADFNNEADANYWAITMASAWRRNHGN
jgi:hypothetical protein